MKDCKNTTEGVIKHMLGGIYIEHTSLLCNITRHARLTGG